MSENNCVWGEIGTRQNKDGTTTTIIEVTTERFPTQIYHLLPQANQMIEGMIDSMHGQFVIDDMDEIPDEEVEKYALVPFLRPLWEQARRNRRAMAKLLKANPLLSEHFTLDSPEVQAVMAGEA